MTLRVVDDHHRAYTTSQRLQVAGRNVVRRRQSAVSLGPADVLSSAPVRGVAVLRLRPGVKVPAVGAPLVVAPGGALPQGLVARVRSTSRHRGGGTDAVVVPASLSDAYSAFTVSSTASLGDALQVTASSPSADLSWTRTTKNVPFSCHVVKGSTSAQFSASADFSKGTFSTTLSTNPAAFSVELISRPTITTSATFSGQAACSLDAGYKLDLPVPDTGGLVKVSLRPVFNVNASGEVYAKVMFQPFVDLFVSRGAGRPNNYFDTELKANVAEASGSAHVELYFGIGAGVSVGGRLGLDLTAGPDFQLDAASTVAAGSGRTCVNVDLSLKVVLTFYAHVVVKNIDQELFSGKFAKRRLVGQCVSTSGFTGGPTSAPTTPGPTPGPTPTTGPPPGTDLTVYDTLDAPATGEFTCSRSAPGGSSYAVQGFVVPQGVTSLSTVSVGVGARDAFTVSVHRQGTSIVGVRAPGGVDEILTVDLGRIAVNPGETLELVVGDADGYTNGGTRSPSKLFSVVRTQADAYGPGSYSTTNSCPGQAPAAQSFTADMQARIVGRTG